MIRLTIGVMGHVDHGKTTLTKALTGIETDRLPEEKRRGLSILPGYAYFSPLPGTMIDLIDLPGHERFVRAMISGAAGIGALMMVVSADEGVRRQTVEHAEIASLLGLGAGLVVVTKSDLAGDGGDAAGADAMALLTRLGIATGPPIAVSVRSGAGLDRLRTALADLARNAASPLDRGQPYLPIDRVFTVAGAGTVVTGTLQGGTLHAGDAVELVPAWPASDPVPARLRDVQIHGATVTRAGPGQRVAVNLRGMHANAVTQGAVLAAPSVVRQAGWLTVRLRGATTLDALATGSRVAVLAGTTEAEARLRLLDRDRLLGGEVSFAQLRCARAMAVPPRARFVLRHFSPSVTVAGGTVLLDDTGRMRRNDPALIARLALLCRPDAAAAAAELRHAGASGLAVAALARRLGVAPAGAIALLQPACSLLVGTGAGATAIDRAAFDGTVATLRRVLAGAGGTLSRARLGQALPDLPPHVLEAALDRLATDGSVVSEAGALVLGSAAEHAARGADRRRLEEETDRAWRLAGLTPPDLAEAPVALRQAVASLIRRGRLIRTRDHVQKRDVLFHAEAVAAARRDLRLLMAGSAGLRVGEIGAALGITRKYCVPLLEHLDGTQFTVRRNDLRVLHDRAGGD